VLVKKLVVFFRVCSLYTLIRVSSSLLILCLLVGPESVVTRIFFLKVR